MNAMKAPKLSISAPSCEGEEQAADERERAHEDDVVAGDARLRVDGAEEPRGAAPCCGPCRRAGAPRRAARRCRSRWWRRAAATFTMPNRIGPPALPATWTNAVSTSGKPCPVAPDQLRRVDLERRQDADDQAGEHGRQQDVAPRVLDLLGERRDAVEADVGEAGDRGARRARPAARRSRDRRRAASGRPRSRRLPEQVAHGRAQEDRAPRRRAPMPRPALVRALALTPRRLSAVKSAAKKTTPARRTGQPRERS